MFPEIAARATQRLNIESRVWLGAEYTDEEREFMVAMDRYKRERHRPFPTFAETLRVLKSLGYRKD